MEEWSALLRQFGIILFLLVLRILLKLREVVGAEPVQSLPACPWERVSGTGLIGNCFLSEVGGLQIHIKGVSVFQTAPWQEEMWDFRGTGIYSVPVNRTP